MADTSHLEEMKQLEPAPLIDLNEYHNRVPLSYVAELMMLSNTSLVDIDDKSTISAPIMAPARRDTPNGSDTANDEDSEYINTTHAANIANREIEKTLQGHNSTAHARESTTASDKTTMRRDCLPEGSSKTVLAAVDDKIMLSSHILPQNHTKAGMEQQSVKGTEGTRGSYGSSRSYCTHCHRLCHESDACPLVRCYRCGDYGHTKRVCGEIRRGKSSLSTKQDRSVAETMSFPRHRHRASGEKSEKRKKLYCNYCEHGGHTDESCWFTGSGSIPRPVTKVDHSKGTHKNTRNQLPQGIGPHERSKTAGTNHHAVPAHSQPEKTASTNHRDQRLDGQQPKLDSGCATDEWVEMDPYGRGMWSRMRLEAAGIQSPKAPLSSKEEDSGGKTVDFDHTSDLISFE